MTEDRPHPALPASRSDQVDRLILDVLASERENGPWQGDVLVVEDETGALTAAALDASAGRVVSATLSRRRAHQLAGEHADAIADGRLRVMSPDEPSDPDGSGTVLLRLPKELEALRSRARRIAAIVGPDALLVAGGRVKHMTTAQNDVLAEAFASVHASRGRGKARCLVAARPLPAIEEARPPEGSAEVAVRGSRRTIALRGTGGVFHGARADAGSLLLLDALDRALVAGELDPQPADAIDLGSGNGLLTAYLAAAFPDAAVTGSDDDLDAVHATRATLAASGLDRPGVDVTWDDALSERADASADLVVLNPPFHAGAAIDATLVQGLLDAAARVLRPGGQLWFVHNSHLRYRAEVERRVGPAVQRARDRRFTVLSARRADH